VVTKFAGSMRGLYGTGPNRAQVASRKSRSSRQLWEASFLSLDACWAQAFRADGFARLEHFASAVQRSLAALAVHALKIASEEALQASRAAPAVEVMPASNNVPRTTIRSSLTID